MHEVLETCGLYAGLKTRSARLDRHLKAKAGGQQPIAPAVTARADVPNSSAKSVPAKKAKAGPVWPYTKTDADVDRAVAKAVTQERARIAAVFQSKASHGRERVCAKLLGMANDWSAGTIIAELPHLPTDANVASDRVAGKRAKTDEVWARANAKVQPQQQAASDTVVAVDQSAGKRAKTDAVWDRANAAVRPQQQSTAPAQGVAASQQDCTTPAARWERANQRLGN